MPKPVLSNLIFKKNHHNNLETMTIKSDSVFFGKNIGFNQSSKFPFHRTGQPAKIFLWSLIFKTFLFQLSSTTVGRMHFWRRRERGNRRKREEGVLRRWVNIFSLLLFLQESLVLLLGALGCEISLRYPKSYHYLLRKHKNLPWNTGGPRNSRELRSRRLPKVI